MLLNIATIIIAALAEAISANDSGGGDRRLEGIDAAGTAELAERITDDENLNGHKVSALYAKFNRALFGRTAVSVDSDEATQQKQLLEDTVASYQENHSSSHLRNDAGRHVVVPQDEDSATPDSGILGVAPADKTAELSTLDGILEDEYEDDDAGRGYDGIVCCDDDMATPTAAPVSSPTSSPVTDPTDELGDGEWGDLYDMNLIPIHAILLPDGNVLSYGTDNAGQQGGGLYYQIWNPAKGTTKRAHKLLELFTGTNIFCSTINVDPSTGNIIVIGGDAGTPDGLGINTVLEFDTATYEVRGHPLGDMQYARWYGTSINLPNGDIFVIGGKSGDTRGTRGSPIPELWSPKSGFRSLDGAEVPVDLSNNDQWWWYPYCYVNSSGEIICIMPSRRNAAVYRVDVGGQGSIESIGTKPFTAHVRNPSVMYRIDHVLFIDDDGWLWDSDISGKTPVWKKKYELGRTRTNGCFVLLPDGRVAIVGGSGVPGTQEDPKDAVRTISVWDPDTDDMVIGPSQELARLYHSTALIMPNGSVLSQGGGAPGPLTNRNGQVYLPNYFYSDLERPIIVSCPRNVATDDSFVIEVDEASAVDRVTVTKSGASTHARNFDTRWLELEFKILNDGEVRVFTEGKNTMIPGLWMINTINGLGVPSAASLFGLDMAPL